MRKALILFTSLGILLSLGAGVRAQTTPTYSMDFDLKFGTSSPYITIAYNGAQMVGYAGAFSASWNGTPAPGFPTLFDTYCVDIAHHNGLVNTYNVNLADTDGLKRVAWLYNTYAGAVTNDKLKSAALQTAIWDVMSGNGDNDVMTGTGLGFKVLGASDSSLIGLANQYLVDSTGKQGQATFFKAQHVGDYYQDMVGPYSVPEPGTLALFLPGLVAFGLIGRRRNKK